MAVYTVTLGNLVKSGYDIGLKDYPIWDETDRSCLNEEIICQYWDREIGAETPLLFIKWLNRAMRQIMPYYCELYKTTQYKIDVLNPLHSEETYNYSDSGSGEGESNIQNNSQHSTQGSANQTANATDNTTENDNRESRELFSDTPQTILQAGQIDEETYLTNATVRTETDERSKNSTQNSSTDNTTTETGTNSNAGKTTTTNSTQSQSQYTKTYKGNMESHVANLIKEYREIIVNIPYEIVTNPKIEACFMGIY